MVFLRATVVLLYIDRVKREVKATPEPYIIIVPKDLNAVSISKNVLLTPPDTVAAVATSN